jgi:hypothetical protein
MMREEDAGLPVEQFVQALSSQLDRAQEAMHLKVRAGMPLTFAIKDITVDLRAHVDMTGSVIRLRPALPSDRDASVLHFTLTTITRPMIEENTRSFAADSNEPSLNEVLGTDFSDDEKRRLEWAGVRTLPQLRDLRRHSGAQAVEQYVNIPAARLRLALDRATHPFIQHVTAHLPPFEASDAVAAAPNSGSAPPLVRIVGANLKQELTPLVRIAGASVPVLRATEREIVVAPTAQQLGGTLEVETAPGKIASMAFELNELSGTSGGFDAR